MLAEVGRQQQAVDNAINDVATASAGEYEFGGRIRDKATLTRSGVHDEVGHSVRSGLHVSSAVPGQPDGQHDLRRPALQLE